MIAADGLTQRYPPDLGALDNVSFIVDAGESYVLLGGTGAGKTTIVNIFLGAIAPTAGTATVAGVNATSRPMDVRRLATFVGPLAALYADLSARQNVEFFARMAHVAATRRVVDNAMRHVGIPDRCFDRSVRDLGRGPSIGLWLAIAGLRGTRALILDDPTAGLDPLAAAEVRENLAEVGRDTALLVASSDVLLAMRLAGPVGLLRQGRLVAERSGPGLAHRDLSDFLLDYPVPSPRESAPIAP